MNRFELNRLFWDFAFNNPEKIKPNHCAIYYFAVEHCNRLGWKEKFGFPTSMVLDATGIKSYSVFKKAFDELVSYGLIEVIEYSKNQYSSNIIALKEINKALDKALDKAFIKHDTKQSESTEQSIDSIIIQLYKYTKDQFTKDNINALRKLIDFDDKFDFKKSLIDLGIEKSVVSDWLLVRKNKKGSNTETAFNDIKAEIEKSEISANECIKYAVVKNWVGFKSDWIKEDDKTKILKSDEPLSISKTLNLYLIPNDDHFGYDQKTLYQRCLDGKYSKRP